MPRRHTPEAKSNEQEPTTTVVVLPNLTALQFLVLDLLGSVNAPVSAYQLKGGLAQLAPGYSGPKFYQLMGRLVRDGLVSAETQPINTPGGMVERTFYSATESGRESLAVTRIFYETRHRIRVVLADEPSA